MQQAHNLEALSPHLNYVYFLFRGKDYLKFCVKSEIFLTFFYVALF